MTTSGSTVAGLQNTSAQRAIRAANLGQVLATVRQNAPVSRAEIATTVDLTRATVSSLVTELISHGLVREEGTASSHKVGRPGQMLWLDERHVTALGVEINVDHTTLVAVDLLGTELLYTHIPFDARAAGARGAQAHLAEVIAAALNEPSMATRRLLGVGVAVPALVDTAGTVRHAPNLGWRDIALGSELVQESDIAERLRAVPILVHNDASLAVVAEHHIGHLVGTANLVYLTGEVGIGAGILNGGQLLRGAHGFAGELGHLALAPSGPRCGCGRTGCLEALAGIEAILRRALPERAPEMTPLAGTELAAAVAETVRRAELGDLGVRAVLQEAGTWLGRGAAHVCNLLDPTAIVLGGYFVPLGPWLLPAANAELQTGAIASPHQNTQLHLSTLGLSAAARGGAAVPLQSLERGQLPLLARGPTR